MYRRTPEKEVKGNSVLVGLGSLKPALGDIWEVFSLTHFTSQSLPCLSRPLFNIWTPHFGGERMCFMHPVRLYFAFYSSLPPFPSFLFLSYLQNKWLSLSREDSCWLTAHTYLCPNPLARLSRRGQRRQWWLLCNEVPLGSGVSGQHICCGCQPLNTALNVLSASSLMRN